MLGAVIDVIITLAEQSTVKASLFVNQRLVRKTVVTKQDKCTA